jgi:hypothetical protein
MEDNNFKRDENQGETAPTIHVNDYGETKDSTVVVEEADRTVLLTDDETIIIPKETMIDLPPKNRARKVYAGMWGTTELVTVGLSMLAILTTILLLVLLVLPAQRELAYNRAQRAELDKKLTEANSRYGTITTTQERVGEIVQSVDDFETNFLPAETNGKAALYQQLNGLIAAYGLTNTSGPDYAPLEIRDLNRGNQDGEAQKGKAKFISIYPGQYITMTLDGPYQNLRRFIREIETNRNQFVIISTVELEPSENKEKETDPARVQQASINNQPTAVNPGGVNPNTYQQPGFPQQNPQQNPQFQQPAVKVDRGKTRGDTVTLRLELAAYYRRPNFQPQTASLER